MMKFEEDEDDHKVQQPPVIKKEEEASQSGGDDENDEEQEALEWYQQKNFSVAKKGDKRWDTLVHNGVMFPPEYEPHGIPINYAGKPFALTPEEEEVATMFAVMKEHDYYRNPIFRKNFFESWRNILDRRQHPIRQLELCDFEPIYQWHLVERETRLNRTREEKKKIKEEADKAAEPFKYCYWDGKKEQVANYRVEPPGLFRGRGKHPLMGKLKARVRPEDVTINISADAPVPVPPPGTRWKEVVHKKDVTWLAMWLDTVSGGTKYVMLAASSSVKGQSDWFKFEKARMLKERVQHIREAYREDWKSSDRHRQQRAVGMYFIDRLALRVGNEKGDNEADTYGCCSLLVKHITLKPDNVVTFDFLGKDSIRYVNDVEVPPEVVELLRRFMKGKNPEDDLFDQLTPTQLNDHLKSFMPGLSAKVFRTYNASITLQNYLRNHELNPSLSVEEKIRYFNEANVEVARLCNHQKAVAKSHKVTMMKLESKTMYANSMVARLEKAREVAQKKDIAAAAEAFFAEQDREQYEWLEQYGTEEMRREYDELVQKRGAPKARRPSKRATGESSSDKKKKTTKSKSSAGKKTKTKKGAEGSTKAAASKGKKKTAAAPKKKAKTEAGNGSAASRGEKAGGRGVKKAEVKDESSDSDDNVPLSAL